MKKGRKISVNSGQLNSKQSDSAPSGLDVLDEKPDNTAEAKTRFDRKGNKITTMIGRF